MRPAGGRVRIRLLRTSEHPALRRLYDAYLSELVGFGANYRRGAGGGWEYRPPDGEWGPDHLRYWLAEGPEHRVLLLRRGNRVLGFAMVGIRPAAWLPPGIDGSIAEFYVVPGARGRGVGASAAGQILRRWPGRWEIREVAGNAPAIAFWRSLLARLPGRAYEELRSDADLAQRFTMSGPRGRASGPAPRRRSRRRVARRRRATRSSPGGARGRRP